MKFRYPDYYERFCCIADRCEDTCCAGWEIDIDDESYAFYRSVPGDFGKVLRENIKEYEMAEEGTDAYERHGFVLKERKRCAFLDADNLCVIYRELGEQALCDVCTDSPRNYLEYGGSREVSLSASCAEAGRLLYGKKDRITFVEKEIEGELDFSESEEELALAEAVRTARDQAILILQDRDYPIGERLEAYLTFAERVQSCLNEDQPENLYKLNKEACFHDATAVENDGDEAFRLFLARVKSFSAMESISEEWEHLLGILLARYIEPEYGKKRYIEERKAFEAYLKEQGREYEWEHMLVYYSFQCLARCVDDYDFLGKAKLVLTSFLMIRDLDSAWYGAHDGVYTQADRVMTARVYAKEVEHSERNLEYLADEFLFEDVYSPENLRASLTIR